MSRRREKRRIAKGGLPPGAILADTSRQARGSSRGARREFYVEVEFTCRDCGIEDAWTPQQQKWFYEVAKGSLYVTATRCQECRKQHAARLKEQRQQMDASKKNRPGS
jgi:hypothetical protein